MLPEAQLWVCHGMGEAMSGKRCFYLRFAETAAIDISSTNLRAELIERHGVTEESLNRLSSDELLAMVAPALGIN